MVLDSIDHAGRYLHLGNGIAQSLHYLQNNDLISLQPGKYELDQERLVMLVFEGENTNTNELRLEGHRKYIDLQYWVSGSELMGHELLAAQPVVDAYDEKKDCAFYSGNACFTTFVPGTVEVGLFKTLLQRDPVP